MHEAFQGLTYCIQTFGCQMNKHDSERIAGMLETLGMLEVDDPAAADIVIYMTCCVRESADTRLYGHVSSLKNMPPRAGSPTGKRIIAIGGCIGQRDGDALIQKMDHVDIVFGTQNIASLPKLIEDALHGGPGAHNVEVIGSSDRFSTELPTKREHPWAAWLPITLGCDNFCTYCIVPHVRGRERSRTIEEIVEEAKRYVDQGVREITLLGQNVNSYGRDLYGDPRFAEVLDAVAATGIDRLRFATSHPKDLSVDVIERFATLAPLMPALHLPFQSGSDRILDAMNRRYTAEHYRHLIGQLRAVRPDIALSTDVIVGFPGETEEDFMETYRLIEEVGYNQVFTFIYSPREGTPAASMPQTSTHEEIQDRFERLVELVQRKAYDSNQAEANELVEVLVEGTSKRDARMLVGKSPKNQTVHGMIPPGRSIEEIVGRCVDVRVTDPKTWYLFGDVVSGPR